MLVGILEELNLHHGPGYLGCLQMKAPPRAPKTIKAEAIGLEAACINHRYRHRPLPTYPSAAAGPGVHCASTACRDIVSGSRPETSRTPR